MRQGIRVLVIVGILLSGASAQAATYAIDKDHTSVSFKIRHLFSKVEGMFRDFSGTIEHDPARPEQLSVAATIQAASIDTRVEQRDTHLRSKDFFDVENYPTITFKSTKVTDVVDPGVTPGAAQLHGVLTIHGVEKPVVLAVAIHGAGKDPWGNVRAGFTGTTTINRKDFGLAWNETLETGQLLVGEEVEITLEVEGLKQE